MALHGDTAHSRLVHRMQPFEKLCAQAKPVGEKWGAWRLISALPRYSWIKLPAPRPTFLWSAGAVEFMAEITAALNPRSLLIATDFSQASEKALRHSLALARFYGSKLCLAHIVSSVGLAMAGPEAIAASEDAVLRESAQLTASLVRTGALTGIQHKFVVRHGELWHELQEIMQEERTDLLVLGTHGRHGIAKLFFGSVAEQIFRQADCPVLTVGPCSYDRPWFETSSTHPTFLFATDFGPASLRVLPQAIAAANQFGARLSFLNIISPSTSDGNPTGGMEDSRMATLERLAQLADKTGFDRRPELYVEFESGMSAGEKILETAEKLEANLIIMGLHESPYNGMISHLDLATTYDVVCQATSPVLTIHRSLESDT
jgi:nucleotide-binding universal stress UspA family protein